MGSLPILRPDATRRPTVKESFRKWFAVLRGKPARAATTLGRKPFSGPDMPPLEGATRTGETIYGDRSLRFRSLTLGTPEDLADLENPFLHGGFKIRVAKLTRGRRQAGTLVENRYASRGYATPEIAVDPHLSTFIAYDEGTLVGTVGLRLDSEHGLSADDLYKAELDMLRRAGCRICEFTRLAVDRTVASKPVLAGLFHTAYLYASLIRGYTHAIIEVNPRHVRFYRKALRFEPVGPERTNRRVNAPAVLLAVPFAAIAEGLHKYAGKQVDVTRSLFPYGFPPDEEAGVLGRLRELVSKS